MHPPQFVADTLQVVQLLLQFMQFDPLMYTPAVLQAEQVLVAVTRKVPLGHVRQLVAVVAQVAQFASQGRHCDPLM